VKETYELAITQVFKDEGGYSNDAGDPGGPTNWGITIHDARTYWKPDATAEDVRDMPKSVAEEIYIKHYAFPLRYDSLPSGIDYAVLDYGINSGIFRSARVLQSIIGVPQDGIIGPNTLAAVQRSNSNSVIDAIYNERLSFLKTLHTWHLFGDGWTKRCTHGRIFAHQLATTVVKPAPQSFFTWLWNTLTFKKGK
jgi:lysozyme family protein